ncbi:MAG: hypothetical protein H6R26_1415, partial [Proteobacteria bacterium]|nr:hypothetical protein [Pseudomonadota bacterium]
MRQEINFYRGGGRRPIPALGVRWILNAALGFVVLLGAISAVQSVVNGRLNAELEMASRQAELMEKRIKDLQALYPEPKADER